MRSSVGSTRCEPRWETPRDPKRVTFGGRIARVARALGTPLMPWQAHVALVAGEMIEDDESGLLVPAYPEVFITVPRQSGKTTFDLSWEVDRCHLWEAWDGKPQAVSYTAQSGAEARKKFREDHLPILQNSPFWQPGTKARLDASDTNVHFSNSSSISVWNNSLGSAHGFTVDLGVLDEIFDDTDDRREQALIPAMATRHDRQKLITSTAGTEDSVVYDRKQEAGRNAVTSGRTEGMAYFEWSADPDDDPENPETWERCMPALGHTITRRTVRMALDEMRKENGDLAEFSRAWLNIPVKKAGLAVIPEATWLAVCSPDVSPNGGLTIGADADPDRAYASIVITDRSGRAELIEHREGVGWVDQFVIELAAKWNAETVVDVSGPLGGLVETLRLARKKVYPMQPREVAYASGMVYDKIADGLISVRSHPLFDEAVRGAQRRQVGDAWVWSRRSTDTDVTPLVAMTLALSRSMRKRRSAYEVDE